MKKILVEAAAVGEATARALAFYTREPEAYYYPNSAWQLPFVGGYQFQTQPGVIDLNAYTSYFFLATGVTPAMEGKQAGQASGEGRNWVETIPGTGWNTILRLYGPLEPWFNKTWHPGEIELQ